MNRYLALLLSALPLMLGSFSVFANDLQERCDRWHRGRAWESTPTVRRNG
jgi:hypothetical protein